MSREIRRVPEDWEHPRDDRGNLIPTHGRFPYNKAEVEEGIEDGWLSDEAPGYGVNVMPQWTDAERTHFQMYETCTEGTPISPVLASPEEVAEWCALNGASAFGDQTASYEAWLLVARGSPSVSAAIDARGMISGVEDQHQHQLKTENAK